MKTSCISMMMADYTQLGQIDYEGCALLLLSVKEVSAHHYYAIEIIVTSPIPALGQFV